MSIDWSDDVLAFHRKFDCYLQPRPGIPTEGIPALRIRLCNEEWTEFLIGMAEGDLPAIADGAIDLIYVLIGTLLSCGIDPRPIWDEVQRTNMAKVGGATRADGKILKPEGWAPPDIARLLREQPPLPTALFGKPFHRVCPTCGVKPGFSHAAECTDGARPTEPALYSTRDLHFMLDMIPVQAATGGTWVGDGEVVALTVPQRIRILRDTLRILHQQGREMRESEKPGA